MAQIPYRANLSATLFPFTLAKSGRSVINPQLDQNFDKRIDPANAPLSAGIPQCIFAKNILPTPEGYQSAGYKQTGTVNILTSPINTIETIRLPTEVSESTVTPDIDVIDEGNQFGSWIKSPNDTGGDDYREVIQDETQGWPEPSYRIGYDRNEDLPAFMYRNFNIQDTDNLTLTIDFQVNGPDPLSFYQVYTKFMNTSVGVGPGVMLSYDPAVEEKYRLILNTSTSWRVAGSLTVLNEVELTETLEVLTRYTLSINAYRNPDSTWTILVNVVKDPEGDNETIGTLNYTGSLNPGGYIGFVNETPVHSGGVRFYNWYDNIHVQANAPDVSYTSVTGIINVDVNFRENNTATWSFGSEDGWDDLGTNLPGGFESPRGPEDFSWALVRGICYVCIKNVDGTTHIYKVIYNDVGPSLNFEEVTSTIAGTLGLAFNINNVIGIVGSYNYLILLTPDSALWSSTTNNLDFAPSLVSGAGSERIGNLKGDICFAKEHVSGFFLYTTNNIVFATYTGNARYPWKFREVGGSSGYSFPQQVAGDTNFDIQYGLSNARTLQAIQPASAELIAPEAAAYLERGTSWDETSGNQFFVRNNGSGRDVLPPDGKYRLWVALDKYIIIGYAYNTEEDEYPSMSHCIIYDIAQKRYGKMDLQFDTVLISDSYFYFVNYVTGAKNKVILSLNDLGAVYESEILLGKFAAVRDYMINMQRINVESGTEAATEEAPLFNLTMFPSYDGKTFDTAFIPSVDPTRSTGKVMSYVMRNTAKNFSIRVAGLFDLCSLDMVFVVEDHR